MELKEQNKKALWAVALANVVAFAAAAHLTQLMNVDLVSVARDWAPLVPAGASIVLVGLLNSLLSSVAKFRLIYWRWRTPQPACAAFSELGPKDARVDMGTIDRRFGPLPKDREAQQRLWYRLYQTVAEHPAISQVHREFLLSRDIACIAVLMAIPLVPAAFYFTPAATASAYTVLLLIEYLMATRSARVHGARFVCNVLALKGTGK